MGRWGQGNPAHPVGGPASPVPAGPSRWAGFPRPRRPIPAGPSVRGPDVTVPSGPPSTPVPTDHLTLFSSKCYTDAGTRMWWNGRHRGLKIPCRNKRAGSSPAIRTLIWGLSVRKRTRTAAGDSTHNGPSSATGGGPICAARAPRASATPNPFGTIPKSFFITARLGAVFRFTHIVMTAKKNYKISY